jgi:hypothetical protein
MQFIIDGTAYDAGSLDRITGLDALELPRQAGIGVQSMARRLEEIGRLAYATDGTITVLPEGATSVDPPVMDSEPHLRALLAFIWMSRRLAGERTLTFDESSSFEFTKLDIVADDEPAQVDVVDPTQPASDLDAVPVVA